MLTTPQEPPLPCPNFSRCITPLSVATAEGTWIQWGKAWKIRWLWQVLEGWNLSRFTFRAAGLSWRYRLPPAPSKHTKWPPCSAAQARLRTTAMSKFQEPFTPRAFTHIQILACQGHGIDQLLFVRSYAFTCEAEPFATTHALGRLVGWLMPDGVTVFRLQNAWPFKHFQIGIKSTHICG
jgi:hypothetical protein